MSSTPVSIHLHDSEQRYDYCFEALKNGCQMDYIKKSIIFIICIDLHICVKNIAMDVCLIVQNDNLFKKVEKLMCEDIHYGWRYYPSVTD